MTTFEVIVDDVVKQEADSLFASLGLDTATAIQIFLKASIANAGIPFPVRHRLVRHDLMEAVTDSRERRNLHGPFSSAEEAVASMLED
jgi:addiction module antitoxin, relB/dinJ family